MTGWRTKHCMSMCLKMCIRDRAVAPQADSHLVGQLSDSGVELRPSHQIAGKGESVAHRFGAGLLPGGHHGGMLRPSSVVVEGAALPAQDLSLIHI